MQSVRAVIEQTIADLKLAKVMNGNKISLIARLEKVLDCVIALHNLRVLLKANKALDIPARRAPVLGAHVFKPLIPAKQVDLKIPAKKPDLDQPSLKHLKAFMELLTSADKAIREAIKLDGKECVFNPTVRQRGYNLYNGAYVLQLRVNNDEMDEWTVKYLVGASYSYEVHMGYFRMSRDNAVIASICDRFSG